MGQPKRKHGWGKWRRGLERGEETGRGPPLGNMQQRVREKKSWIFLGERGGKSEESPIRGEAGGYPREDTEEERRSGNGWKTEGR